MIKQSLVICGLLAALTFCSSHNTEDTAEGLAGTVGAEGAGGPQGEVGVPGVQGPMGAQGIAGQDGAVGERGEVGPAGQNATDELEIQLLGRAVLNSETPKGAAETVAYQASQDRVFAVNSAGDESVVAIVSTKDVGGIILRPNTEGVTTETNLSSSFQISVGTYTDGQAKGLAVSPSDRLLIVALAAKAKSQSGQIAIYDISADEPVFIKNIAVGFQPDMVTFTPDGKKILVVNEGEPMGDYSVDPEGSISVIEVVDGAVADEAVQVSFRAFNDQKDALESQGVVFANPTGRTIKGKLIQTTVAQDLEPEHIAVSSDSQTAYVSLQENNALAILDLTTSPVSVEIKGLGFKDWLRLNRIC